MSTLENERILERVDAAIHDGIVRVPGGSRIRRDGQPIRPMGTKLAATTINRLPDQVRNMADPFKDDHLFHAKDLHTLTLEGMDPAWMEELAHGIGMVCIRVPDADASNNLSNDMLSIGERLGRICSDTAKAIAPDSPGGRSITAREEAAIRRDTDDAIAALYGLLATLSGMVRKPGGQR